MIAGVSLKPLKIIPDDRGAVMHMLRRDWPEFAGFGEVYFSCIEPGAVKAWRKHTQMTLQLAVPVGAADVVLFDDRAESATSGKLDVIRLGVEDGATYALLCVPPGIWSGFKGISSERSVIVNCGSIPHDPDEAERLDSNDPAIPYTWS